MTPTEPPGGTPTTGAPGDDASLRRVGRVADEFLDSPVLSEILEDVPPTWTRAIVYLLVAFLLTGVLYAYFGKTDEVVRGEGNVIPAGDAAVVQAAKNGQVARLSVKEGDTVRAGQLLAELDVTPARLESEKREKEYEKQKRDRACARYALEVFDAAFRGQRVRVDEREILKLCSPDDAEALLATRKAAADYEAARLYAEKANPRSIASLAVMVKSKEDNLALKRKQLEDAERELGRATVQMDLNNQMFQRGLASRLKLLEEQKKYDDAVNRVSEARVAIGSAEAELEEARVRLEGTQIQNDQAVQRAREGYELALLKYRATVASLQTKLANLQSTTAAFELDAQIHEYSRKLDQIVAPVGGRISSVRVRTPGEVAKAGDVLFTINPSGQPLVARVMVPNRAIGRVTPGQRAKVKIDAYPYQSYGVVAGRVLTISPDARPGKEGSFYEVTVGLDRESVVKDGVTYPIFPGLTLVAEIVVEQRRIIDHFLDPFRKLKA